MITSVPSDDWLLPHSVDSSQGPVAYNVMGHGPPVVLVHGTPSNSYLWRWIAPALARFRTVYVYDMPGFGASPLSAAATPAGLIRAQAEVLAQLVMAWGLSGPALVGHDIGGGAVMRAHLLHGIAVERVALIDAAVLSPWITPRSRDVKQRLSEVRELPVEEFARLVLDHLDTATVRRLPELTRRRLFGQWDGPYGQARYLDNLASFDEQDTDDFAHLLSSATMPVMLLWGAEDRWLPVSMARRLEGQLPTSQLVVVADAGHFAMEDQPQPVLDALRSFLHAE